MVHFSYSYYSFTIAYLYYCSEDYYDRACYYSAIYSINIYHHYVDLGGTHRATADTVRFHQCYKTVVGVTNDYDGYAIVACGYDGDYYYSCYYRAVPGHITTIHRPYHVCHFYDQYLGYNDDCGLDYC